MPSAERPELVPSFARRLAEALGIPFRAAVRKVCETRPQEDMENSAQQLLNVLGAFEADPGQVLEGPVLLVDDIVDSRWTR